MPKFKKPLSEHPFHQWGQKFKGFANVNFEYFIRDFVEEVTSKMEAECDIPVKAEIVEIEIGGFLFSSAHPGVNFTFVKHPKDYASILVGFSKTAGILSVDAIQYGTCSGNMRLLNSADQKGTFSVMGALQRAMTDYSKIERESMHYTALLQTIENVVLSYASN